MALSSTVISNSTNSTILAGTTGKLRAVTCLFLCNTNTTTADTVTIHAVANGQSATATNTIIKSTEINATDTLTFDTEKLLLGDGDSLQGQSVNGTISATVSYTDV